MIVYALSMFAVGGVFAAFAPPKAKAALANARPSDFAVCGIFAAGFMAVILL